MEDMDALIDDDSADTSESEDENDLVVELPEFIGFAELHSALIDLRGQFSYDEVAELAGDSYESLVDSFGSLCIKVRFLMNTANRRENERSNQMRIHNYFIQ